MFNFVKKCCIYIYLSAEDRLNLKKKMSSVLKFKVKKVLFPEFILNV